MPIHMVVAHPKGRNFGMLSAEFTAFWMGNNLLGGQMPGWERAVSGSVGRGGRGRAGRSVSGRAGRPVSGGAGGWVAGGCGWAGAGRGGRAVAGRAGRSGWGRAGRSVVADGQGLGGGEVGRAGRGRVGSDGETGGAWLRSDGESESFAGTGLIAEA